MNKAEQTQSEPKFSDENIAPNIIAPTENKDLKQKSEKTTKTKKIRKHHKQTSISILKKEGANLLPQKNNNSIKWDNQVIEDQNIHNRGNKNNKKMKSQSQTKYLNYGDEEDLYIKNLNKLNELKFSDDCLKNMVESLKKSDDCAEEKNKNVFDENLDYESKITLKNTLLNKFHKEIRGKSLNNLPCENLNLTKKE